MWAVVVHNTNRPSEGSFIDMFLKHEVAEREAVLWADAGKQFIVGLHELEFKDVSTLERSPDTSWIAMETLENGRKARS